MGGRTVWLFGHQLSMKMPALVTMDRGRDTILIVKAASRAGWLAYHKQKIAFVYAAMAHFVEELRSDGYRVDYRTAETFDAGWTAHVAEWNPSEVCIHVPTEDRFRRMVLRWAAEDRPQNVKLFEESALFLVGESEWETLLPDGQQWRLDGVYRLLRQRFSILMDGKKPEGGKWNYDQDNRKPPKKGLQFEPALFFPPDECTKQVIEDVEQSFSDCPGRLDSFAWPVTRQQAAALLDHFLEHRLPTFGEYQDAMMTGNLFMSHSLLSAVINVGLLDPLEVIRKAEHAYREAKAPLAAVEGFIRQILGWREYVRGVYLRSMPEYAQLNALGHTNPLPSFYWTGETKMNCMHQVVTEVIQYSYSHHIQRLMVLGNFANLAGIRPQEVSDWFNQMYVDAYDWVVLPNVLGMALYADGGKMSSKPYISSGLYIDKMSDYCDGCAYDVRKRTGENACPFHSLYWHFIHRHQEKLSRNARMGQVVSAWKRMEEPTQAELLEQAEYVLDKLAGGEL